MAYRYEDMVWETGTCIGVGAATCGGAIPGGYGPFSAAWDDGDTGPILILDLTTFLWEKCDAEYDSGTNTLTRGTLKSSSTGSRIDFGAGDKWITNTPAAGDLVLTDTIAAAVVAAMAARAISAAGLATGGGDLSANRTITVPAASQAEAEAGSINDKAMTPLRAAQARLAWVGGLVSSRVLATYTPTATASQSVTGLFSSAYTVYEVEFINVIPVTDDDTPKLQVTQGGVAQTSGNYFFTSNFTRSAGAAGDTGSESANDISMGPATSNAAGNGGFSGTVQIVNPLNATGKKQLRFEGSSIVTAGQLHHLVGAGVFKGNNTAIDGFLFFFGAGNIASGKIVVRGII